MSKITEKEITEFSNCGLFQRSQARCAPQAGNCGVGGERTSCNGDILYCERLDILRDYVLKKIEKISSERLPRSRAPLRKLALTSSRDET
jgi:hypothetical protein